MANPEHLAILEQGVKAWNEWREENPEEVPDLSKADLSRANLGKANFERADLAAAKLLQANLREARFQQASLLSADLPKADLTKANLFQAALWLADLTSANLSHAFICNASLRGANLSRAHLIGANLVDASLKSTVLRGANLSEADLTEADLQQADLRKANLREAKLVKASLVETKLQEADLRGCRVYGISAWNLQLQGAQQSGLLISRPKEPTVTVDNLEVAQFVYLLLNNDKIRHVIDTITSKVVLILGRFTSRRKAVLDAIRQELRKDEYDYVPVVFDFDRPASRDLEETITLLARMSRFIIADITNPKCIPQELGSIVKDLPSVPVQPILRQGAKPWGMYSRIRRFPSVLPLYRYRARNLLRNLRRKVIEPAEAMVEQQLPED